MTSKCIILTDFTQKTRERGRRSGIEKNRRLFRKLNHINCRVVLHYQLLFLFIFYGKLRQEYYLNPGFWDYTRQYNKNPILLVMVTTAVRKHHDHGNLDRKSAYSTSASTTEYGGTWEAGADAEVLVGVVLLMACSHCLLCWLSYKIQDHLPGGALFKMGWGLPQPLLKKMA